MNTAAYKENRYGADVAYGAVRLDAQSVTCSNCVTVDGDDLPMVKISAAESVGHAQRLDSGCKREHRIIRNKEKTEPNRWLVCGSIWH